MSTEITVRGSYGASQPPERCTVHASISYEGPTVDEVYTRVARDLEVVQTSVAELQSREDPAVTWWAAERLRTWSTRPWNQDGKQLPPVHHARVSMEVKFRDFAALSDWVGKHVRATDGFRVVDIRWALTEKRRDELIRRVRERAVHDALDRAQQYASALGLGEVSPVAIADAGMLVASLRPDRVYGQPHTVARSGQAAPHPSLELVPEDIEVSASVDARFVVEDSRPSALNPRAETAEPREVSTDLGRPDAGPDVIEFRDDDASYLAWVAAHPNGYVINILRSHSPTNARLHHASCWTISGSLPHGGFVTGQYVKVCAERLSDLDEWVLNHVGHLMAM